MRKLTGHMVNDANEQLEISVLDEPGAGGANHQYSITMPPAPDGSPRVVLVSFQNGPIKEAGVNGVTHEALLEILADRLRMFQGGRFACTENAEALDFVLKAQRALKQRTQKRIGRGVEGTHQV